jgi:hypothetical protein
MRDDQRLKYERKIRFVRFMMEKLSLYIFHFRHCVHDKRHCVPVYRLTIMNIIRHRLRILLGNNKNHNQCILKHLIKTE